MDPAAELEVEEEASPKGTGAAWGSSSSAVLAGRQQRVRPRIGRNHQAQVPPYRLDLEHHPPLASEDDDNMEARYAQGLPFLPLTYLHHLLTITTAPQPPPDNNNNNNSDRSAESGAELASDATAAAVDAAKPRKRKRRGSRWGRLGKIPKKNAAAATMNAAAAAMDSATMRIKGSSSSKNAMAADVAADDGGAGGVFVPGEQPAEWAEGEAAAFVLGLHLFGKELNGVKRFVGSKAMKDVMHYYYGQFYRSQRFLRWSSTKNSQSRRCVHGARIVSGWRQQELLHKMDAHLPDDPARRQQLQKAAKAFNAGETLLEEFVAELKAVAGLELLVQSVGVGSHKLDLTAVHVDRCGSRTESLPAGKAFSTLSTDGIIKFLVGDFRISKMRAKDLFWEAVWPRLLARDWRSEEIGSRSALGPKNTLVFFHSCARDVNEADLEKGVHYFDSVSGVLDLVAADPSLLDHPDGDDISLDPAQYHHGGEGDAETQQEWCTDPRAAVAAAAAARGDTSPEKEPSQPYPAATHSSCEPTETSADLMTCEMEEHEPESWPRCSSPHPQEEEGHRTTSAPDHESSLHVDLQPRDAHDPHGADKIRDGQSRCNAALSGRVMAQSTERVQEPVAQPPSSYDGTSASQVRVCEAPIAVEKEQEAEELDTEQQVPPPDRPQPKETKFVDICEPVEPVQVRPADQLPSRYDTSATPVFLEVDRREQAEDDTQPDCHARDVADSGMDEVDAFEDGHGELLQLQSHDHQAPGAENTCDEKDDTSDGGDYATSVQGSLQGLVSPAGVSEVDGCLSDNELIVSQMGYGVQDLQPAVVRCSHEGGAATDDADGIPSNSRQLKVPDPLSEPSLVQFSALGKDGVVSTVVFLRGGAAAAVPRSSPPRLPAAAFRAKPDRPVTLWSSPPVKPPPVPPQLEELEVCGAQLGLCTYKRRRSVWSVVQPWQGEPHAGVFTYLPPHNATLEDNTHETNSLVPVKRARSFNVTHRRSATQPPQSTLMLDTARLRRCDAEGRCSAATDLLCQFLNSRVITCLPAAREGEDEGAGALASRLIEMPSAAVDAQPMQLPPPSPEPDAAQLALVAVAAPSGAHSSFDLAVESMQCAEVSEEFAEPDTSSGVVMEQVGEYYVEGGDDCGSSLVTTESNLELSMTTAWPDSQNDTVSQAGAQVCNDDPVTPLTEKRRPIKPVATKGWEKPDRGAAGGVAAADPLALAFSFQSFAKTYTRSPKLGKRGTTVWAAARPPSIPKLLVTIPSPKRCTVVEAEPFEVEKVEVKQEDASSVESNTKGIKRKRSERVRRRAGWRYLFGRQGLDGDDDAEDDLFCDESVSSPLEWKYPFRSCRAEGLGPHDPAWCHDSAATREVEPRPSTRLCCACSFCSNAASSHGTYTGVRPHRPKVSRSSRSRWKAEPGQHNGGSKEAGVRARRPRHGVWFAPHTRAVAGSPPSKPETLMRRRLPQQGGVC